MGYSYFASPTAIIDVFTTVHNPNPDPDRILFCHPLVLPPRGDIVSQQVVANPDANPQVQQHQTPDPTANPKPNPQYAPHQTATTASVQNSISDALRVCSLGGPTY